MTTTTDLPIPATPANLPAILDFLGPAPLIRSEQHAGYDTLLARVTGAVKPADIFEEFWARDVVDLVWEAIRLRRLKAELLTVCADEGLVQILHRFEGVRANGLAKSWAAGDAGAALEVGLLLASAGLTLDAVMARTLRLHISEIERIDRMIAGAEARRNVALRELGHHRATFAATLRRVTDRVIDQVTDRSADNVEDAEFEVVAPGAAQPAAGHAA